MLDFHAVFVQDLDEALRSLREDELVKTVAVGQQVFRECRKRLEVYDGCGFRNQAADDEACFGFVIFFEFDRGLENADSDVEVVQVAVTDMRECKSGVVGDAVSVFALNHFLCRLCGGDRQSDGFRHACQKVRVELGAIVSFQIEKDQALVQKR